MCLSVFAQFRHKSGLVLQRSAKASLMGRRPIPRWWRCPQAPARRSRPPGLPRFANWALRAFLFYNYLVSLSVLTQLFCSMTNHAYKIIHKFCHFVNYFRPPFVMEPHKKIAPNHLLFAAQYDKIKFKQSRETLIKSAFPLYL